MNIIIVFHSIKVHAVFHSLLYYNTKQYAATIAAHRKWITQLLENRQLIFSGLNTIWDNTYGCTYHYRYDTALYLSYILSKAFHINIHSGISTPCHVREVVEGLNSTEKSFLFHLMDTLQLPISQISYAKNPNAHINAEF